MSKRSGVSATRLNEDGSYSRRLMTNYILINIAEICGVLVLYFAAAWSARRIVWQYNIFYRILNFLEDTSMIWMPVLLVGIFLWNTFRTLKKPLLYLDRIVEESGKLADPSRGTISLPQDLESVEYQMNMIRARALENRRRAEEAEQRKNDMVVYLAHDLKTPLTSVIGYLSLLDEETDLPEEQRRKFVSVALNKAYRLEDLINEFFEITRFNLTNITIEKNPLNLSRMLEQIIFEFQPSLVEKNLQIDLDEGPDITVMADADKMERVIDNLIRNAISYSYDNTVISVSLKKEEKDVLLQVVNHGNTISPEKLGRIFEQFFRADSSRATKTGGAGLGLAIAKEIVQLHGGTIRAESADNTVTFKVTLPLR